MLDVVHFRVQTKASTFRSNIFSRSLSRPCLSLMSIFNVIKQRRLHKNPESLWTSPSSSSLHNHSHSHSHSRSRSLPRKENHINWNTTHTFIVNNPLLSLLEKSKSLHHLKQTQAQMIITDLVSDGFASSRLIAFCALSQSRNLHYCTKILQTLKNPNVFSWNMAIRAFAESENSEETVFLYKRMLRNGGSRPDHYTYPFLFKVCADLALVSLGYEILGHVLKLGLDIDVYVNNAVIHMFACCGELRVAHKVFDESWVRDLVSWNSLINGYAKSDQARHAIELFRRMESEGVDPDDMTMIGVVSSCSQLEDLNFGRDCRKYIEDKGLKLTVPLANALMGMYMKCGDLEAAQDLFNSMEMKSMVSWTTMIVGYAKCGLLDIARKLFNDMPEKDVLPWNAIIGGYVQAKRGKDALALFHEMQVSDVVPNEVTMIHCLSVCSQLGALDIGIWIHHYIKQYNLHINVALGTALVDMYAKCGNIAKSLQVFHDMAGRNSLTWTALIGGLALHGDALGALHYFRQMLDTGLIPDEITFLGVLSACCHGGLVEEGREYFSQMRSKFNLSPRLKHYSCMVDLLGRAGHLEEAERLIESMPIKADAVVWGALFFACRMHGNVTLGERAASKLLYLDPRDSGIYVLLCNMYREANMWEEARRVRQLMKERGVEKTPGCSSIEVNGIVSEFIVRDKSHSEAVEIYDCLLLLGRHMEFRPEADSLA